MKMEQKNVTQEEVIHMFEGMFGDTRLAQRGETIFEAMKQHETAILNQCCSTHAEKIGAYRFFANEAVTKEAALSAGVRQCTQAVAGRHVLAIEDTTSIDMTAHAGLFDPDDAGLGPIESPTHLGFFVHPVLAVDADQAFPLGIGSVTMWSRPRNHPSKTAREYKTVPFEQKESARWVTSIQASASAFDSAEHVTVVADRESDIYDVLATVPDEQTDVLIRACQNRCVEEDLGHLFASLEASPVADTYALDVVRTPTRQARTATMEVRCRQLSIRRPATASRTLPKTVSVWAVDTLERPETVPPKEKPIHWRLLTTHPVRDATAAHLMIHWYHLRWLIEELFRVLKRQGFNVEASQLGDGKALWTLVMCAILAAMPILQLTLERDGTYGLDAALVFSDEELAYQDELGPTLEGKTARQQNPFPRRTLAWSAWMIGRLGGWNGYRSQSPPGYITMKRGLERFAQRFLGWRVAQGLC
jgi:hypothetical protein